MPEITIHLRREPQLPRTRGRPQGRRYEARWGDQVICAGAAPIGNAAVLLVNRGIAKRGDTVVAMMNGVEFERDTVEGFAVLSRYTLGPPFHMS